MDSISVFLFRRIKLASLFFLIASFYGLMMRWQHVQLILPYRYINILQAHSHVTFLGWGFLSVISLVTVLFTTKEKRNRSVYKYTFWIMSFSIVGMLISFPLQGYKVFSIVFLTIYLLTSYIYLFFLLKDIDYSSISSRFIKWGILYYYISSLGIWGLSIISVKLGKGDLYHHAISFYTHFLYNGYFVLTLFGILVKYIEIKEINISNKVLLLFFKYTNIAVIPTFVLSIIWDIDNIFLVLIALSSALIQLFSIKYLWEISKKLCYFFDLKGFSLVKVIFKAIILAYIFKLVLQFFGAFPSIATIALQQKHYFVIGYIHLFTLAFMSLFILLLFKITININLNKVGFWFLFTGIIISETLLFTQGTLQYLQIKTISNYHEILLMASIFMFVGISFIYARLKILTIK